MVTPIHGQLIHRHVEEALRGFTCCGQTNPQPARHRRFPPNASRRATGDILIFLHADTVTPREVVTLVRGTLADRRNVLGGFVSLLTTPEKASGGSGSS